MRTTTSRPKVRLNLDIAPEVKDELERLRDCIHADSMTEVVRRSLSLYAYMLAQQKDGKKISIHDHDGSESRFLII